MSAFLRPILGGLGQFLYILLIYVLFGLKKIASHTSMQIVRSNEKNNIIYSSSMSEQMRNVESHARLSGNKIIYPNSMNREDLSKMSKDELINMLLGKQTVSANKTGPVKQTASAKQAGPVFKPKSLTQLAAEKLEQSIKGPAVLPKQSTRLPTLKTLAARALVKDRIKYFEELSDTQVTTIRLDKIPVSLQDMRDEELKRARVSKYKKQSSFQNLFHEKLEQMPGKRERAQITINTVIEHTIGDRTDKTYGPFKMEVPKLSKPDMYKFLMYTLLQNNFTILSTETIAEIGATISTHNEQFFKDHVAGALKLNTFFLDKQFQIKQRGENTCMVDFVWHNCKGKKGFQKYRYQKLYDEMEVYGSASFPMMSTQELIDWAKACHPNVSIHVYDSTWRKFMKHISNEGHQGHVISLVFYIKDHHLYPIQDDRLKQIATKANQGGADNLWRYMTDMKWSNKSSNYIMYEELENNELTEEGKPTLLTIENHVIVLPPDMKIEPVIEAYIIRTNYFVEYLHYDNNGR